MPSSTNTSKTFPVIFEETVALLLATTYPEASNMLVADEPEAFTDLTVKVVTSWISSSASKNHKPIPTIAIAPIIMETILVGKGSDSASLERSIFKLFKSSSFSLITSCPWN